VRCPTGEARITPGFALPARFVIHTVGPVWDGGDDGEPERLAACYRNSLHLARENGLASMAFPAISCGVFGYPVEKAARVAVTEVSRHNPTDMQIILCCRGEKAFTSYRQAARNLGIE
jgi:O-acetyl-ADP-ribose deacetylase (regulator of RNase III)